MLSARGTENRISLYSFYIFSPHQAILSQDLLWNFIFIYNPSQPRVMIAPIFLNTLAL